MVNTLTDNSSSITGEISIVYPNHIPGIGNDAWTSALGAAIDGSAVKSVDAILNLAISYYGNIRKLRYTEAQKLKAIWKGVVEEYLHTNCTIIKDEKDYPIWPQGGKV